MKKLSLHKETLHALDQDDVREVRGGEDAGQALYIRKPAATSPGAGCPATGNCQPSE